jgi:hypothetical protein
MPSSQVKRESRYYNIDVKQKSLRGRRPRGSCANENVRGSNPTQELLPHGSYQKNQPIS